MPPPTIRITTPRMICVTELKVLDAIRFTPFDLRVVLPADTN